MSEVKYSVVTDKEHGFRRLEPVPSCEEIEEFYSNQYYSLIEEGKRGPDIRRLLAGGEAASEQLDWQTSTLYGDVTESLKSNCPRASVLEVGCGTGDLLMHLQAQGFDVHGVEIAKAAADFATERGLEVSHGAFEDFAQQSDNRERYGGVLLMNVLEQTRDPMAFLQYCSDVLVPGGSFVIRSGNEFNPLQQAACQSLGKREWWVSTPDQINYFSFASMEKMLDAVGFEVIEKRSDFPMEMFLLMGEDYVDSPEVGGDCHQRRVQFEMALRPEVRRQIYRSFANVGIGRCVYFVAKKRA